MTQDIDKPASNEVGAPESEITPEMLDAGVAVYLEHCPDSGAGDALDRKMVGEIFSAMATLQGIYSR